VLIDCDTCEVRGPACADCVVSVLLGAPPALDLDPAEQAAIDVLAGSGLVPPLRLVRPAGPADRQQPADARRNRESGSAESRRARGA
jgi:hypothetical protein